MATTKQHLINILSGKTLQAATTHTCAHIYSMYACVFVWDKRFNQNRSRNHRLVHCTELVKWCDAWPTATHYHTHTHTLKCVV